MISAPLPDLLFGEKLRREKTSGASCAGHRQISIGDWEAGRNRNPMTGGAPGRYSQTYG